MKAYIHTQDGTKVVKIKEVDVKMTKVAEDRMMRKFNNEVRVMEWVGGVTYSFQSGARFIKSSSLEEIEQMFKAHFNKLPIPERKCFLNK